MRRWQLLAASSRYFTTVEISAGSNREVGTVTGTDTRKGKRMLASVSEDSDRFENLRDYVVGNKRAPVHVPSAGSKPRLEAKPGSQVPGPAGKLPTSSQRPGKQTNQSIVYGRVVFTDFLASAANPSDILSGDVVLVNKTKNNIGHDTNRPSKVASYRQVNAMLNDPSDAAVLTKRHVDKMLKSRQDVLSGLEQTRRILADDLSIAQKRGLTKKVTLDDLQETTDEINFLLSEIDLIKAGKSAEKRFVPVYDWMSVPLLADWIPDGVLLSRDDDEFNSDYFKKGGGDSGTVMNVVLQGPTLCRNSKSSKMEVDPLEFEQLFDPAPIVRDQILLLLLCEELVGESGAFEGYAFRYKPTSARILEELGRTTTSGESVWEAKPDTPYPNAQGLTHREVTNTIAAWRIASVMDNKATNISEPKINVNVNVEFVSAYKLWRMYGNHVCASYAPWMLKKARKIDDAP